MDIGKELKRIRELNGLSAKIFADYIGIGPERMRKWEDGKSNPKLEDQKIISNYFGIDLEDLPNIGKFKFTSKPLKKIVEQTISENYSTDEDKSTIKDLAKSIVLLSDMGKTLADSNRDVVIMLKESQSNSSSVRENRRLAEGELQSCMVLIAKMLVKEKLVATEDEALLKIGRCVFEGELALEQPDKSKQGDIPNKQKKA